MMTFAPATCPEGSQLETVPEGLPGAGTINCVAHIPPPGSGPNLTTQLIQNQLIQPYVDDIRQSLATIIRSTSTFFVSAPTRLTPGSNAAIDWVRQNTLAIAAVIMLITVLIAAAKMVLSQNGEGVAEVGKGLGMMILITGSSTAVVGLILAIGDAFSIKILADATAGTPLGENLVTMITGSEGAIGGVLLFIMMVLSALAGLVLYAEMFCRIPLLVGLLGALPITAATWSTPAGKQATMKQLGWIAGVAAAKPGAAMIVATSLRLMSSDLTATDGVMTFVQGFVTLLLAVVMMPALLRLVAPATAALSGSGGGSGGSSLAAAGAAVATTPTGAAAVAKGAQAAGGAASGAASASGSGGSADGASGGSKGGAATGGSEPANGGQQPAEKGSGYKWGGTSTSPSGPDLN